MIFLYNIFIFLYRAGVRVAAVWNAKAKEWLEGRKNIFKELAETVSKKEEIIWFHSASAGEFEQAKPVIEQLKTAYPHYKILVTFYSPSGYKVAKKYPHADYIFYLPVDRPANAKRFLKTVNPKLVVFVKYDFWFYYLKAVRQSNIPLVLISSVFRKDQLFFKNYGSFYRKMLSFFTWIFVQDKASLQLLNQHHFKNCSIGGDTRFDRVEEIAGNFTEVPLIKEFIGRQKSIVAGSTWPDDEAALAQLIKNLSADTKIIIAPHEIHSGHIEKIEKEFPGSLRYSQIKDSPEDTLSLSAHQTLIIDNVGMLSRLYKYATITYIGGGFTKDGIHNILEAAVFGKPVVFGPNYKKYREAKELIAAGGAFSFSSSEELLNIVSTLMQNETARQNAGHASLTYINNCTGATKAFMDFIYKNRLLTK